MAHRLQGRPHGVIQPRLQGQPVVALVVTETGRVRRRLGVGPEVEHVLQDLQLALRLLVAEHHADAEEGLAVLQHEARDDGVEGPLAGAITLGLAGSRLNWAPRLLSRKP